MKTAEAAKACVEKYDTLISRLDGSVINGKAIKIEFQDRKGCQGPRR